MQCWEYMQCFTSKRLNSTLHRVRLPHGHGLVEIAGNVSGKKMLPLTKERIFEHQLWWQDSAYLMETGSVSTNSFCKRTGTSGVISGVYNWAMS